MSEDVCRVLTVEMLKAVIGKEFSRPTIDLHPDRFRHNPLHSKAKLKEGQANE